MELTGQGRHQVQFGDEGVGGGAICRLVGQYRKFGNELKHYAEK